MAGDLLLLTGGTGHIGFRTLLLALDAGYYIRAAVRSQEKADALLEATAVKALDAGSRLSFVVVPDLTAPHAYDEAVKGVKYIIHIASPLVNPSLKPDQFENAMIAPAVQGTIGLLKSAKKILSVNRVVITSSIAAQVPPALFTGEPAETIFREDSRLPTPEGPFTHPFVAYAASKTKALNESEAWICSENPHFDVVHIHPSFVIGRDDFKSSREGLLQGTNACVLDIVLGKKNNSPLVGLSVHLDDVARLHVQALNPNIPGNCSYLAHSNNPIGTLDGTTWEDAIAITEKYFPNAVSRGVIPNNGVVKTNPVRIDARKTEETFGFTHMSYDEQVKSVVGHYLEVVAKD